MILKQYTILKKYDMMNLFIIFILFAFIVLPSHERGKNDWSAQDNTVINKAIERGTQDYIKNQLKNRGKSK